MLRCHVTVTSERCRCYVRRASLKQSTSTQPYTTSCTTVRLVFLSHTSRGGGETSPPEFGAMQILSRCNISNTRLLVLQWTKKLTNPMTLTEYSLFPKSTSSMSTKSPVEAKNSTFFWKGDGQNIYRSECTKTRHFKWKFFFNFFLGRGHSPQIPSPVGRGTPLHTPPLTPTKPPGSARQSPRILARFTPLFSHTRWVTLSWVSHTHTLPYSTI